MNRTPIDKTPSTADRAEQDVRAPVLDEDKAEPATRDEAEDGDEIAIDLPIEENQFNVQPG